MTDLSCLPLPSPSERTFTKHLLYTLISALRRQAGRQAGPCSQFARSALQTHDRPLLSRTRDCTASGTVAVDEDQDLGPCLRGMG